MKYKIALISIIALAFFLRFWQLGANPASLDWDEASLGYNAYSILKTGRDEYGRFLPLSIKSFGDYKPPLYSYLTIIPVAILGLTEFSTRFTSAFFGFLAVIVAYFLIKELFPKRSRRFYLFFTFLFSISPWQIQFSRVAFEANLGLFFFMGGVLFFLKGLRKKLWYLFSAFFFALSIYAYHSPRLISPLMLLGLLFIFRKYVVKNLKWLVVSIVVLGFLVAPVYIEMRTTGARLGSVTIMNDQERLGNSIGKIEFDRGRSDLLGVLTHNRRVVYGFDILTGYLDHFNFDFLFLYGDAPGRHHALNMGMLYLWTLPFILFGFYYMLNHRDERACVIFLWFLLAPAAASITTGTPHAVRSLEFIPTYQIFTAVGFFELLYILREKIRPEFYKSFVSLAVFLLLVNFFYYMQMYWVHTPVMDSQSWQYGYKQAVTVVDKYASNYKRIIVTYRYDQPYVFFLFYNKTDPVWYQKNWGSGQIQRANRSFGKYEFRNIDWAIDSKLSDTLLVGTPDEIPPGAGKLLSEIHFLDGSVAFRIVGR
ncbi:MAG: glycosyltransferase family 39 protein [Patescibacteria group bacterium]|nr:glycosyltransferase family 39 protein [Patescibacteria group bacterium]